MALPDFQVPIHATPRDEALYDLALALRELQGPVKRLRYIQHNEEANMFQSIFEKLEKWQPEYDRLDRDFSKDPFAHTEAEHLKSVWGDLGWVINFAQRTKGYGWDAEVEALMAERVNFCQRYGFRHTGRLT